MVGVLQKREQFLFGGGSDDQNNVIYLPYNVARKLKPNADDIYILAVAKPGMMKEAMDQVAICCACAARCRSAARTTSEWRRRSH